MIYSLRNRKQTKVNIHNVNKVYLFSYGGYGDTFMTYIHGGAPRGKQSYQINGRYGKGSYNWDILHSFKKNFPHIVIKAIVMSGNPQSAILVENDPAIDIVVHIPTVVGINIVDESVHRRAASHADGWTHIDDILNIRKLCEPKLNNIHISNADNKIQEKVHHTTSGQYIFIHPFASIPARRPVSPRQYIPLADAIWQEFGYQSVVVGNSYNITKKDQNGDNIVTKVYEHFPYRHEALINLVGFASLPLCSAIMLKSKAVIGTWSCHTTTSFTFSKPSVIFTSQHAMWYLQAGWLNNPNKQREIAKNLTLITSTIDDRVINTTIEHLKKYIIND